MKAIAILALSIGLEVGFLFHLALLPQSAEPGAAAASVTADAVRATPPRRAS